MNKQNQLEDGPFEIGKKEDAFYMRGTRKKGHVEGLCTLKAGARVTKTTYKKDVLNGLCVHVYSWYGNEKTRVFEIGTRKDGKRDGKWIFCGTHGYTMMLFQNGVKAGQQEFHCRPSGDTAKAWNAFREKVLKKLENVDEPIFDFRPILEKEWVVDNDFYKKEYMEKQSYKLIRHVKDAPGMLSLSMKMPRKTKSTVRKRLKAGEAEGNKLSKKSKQK